MQPLNRRHWLKQMGVAPAVGSFVSAIGAPAWAQPTAWPSRPIQFIVGAPAGGGVDTTSRKLCELMGAALNTSVVVINRPGAAALIGAQMVANAPPDGYTVGYFHSGHVVLQAMENKLKMETDFTPVGLFGASQFCIAVHADSPYRTVAELFSAAEKHPGKLNYGAGGDGSPGHIAFEKIVNLRPTLKVVQVPFKGAAEAVLALVGKQIDFVCGVLSTVLPLHRSGRVRILAVTSAQRAQQLPEVPTLAEGAGLPGYEHVSWGGLCGPAKLPKEIVDKYFSALRTVVNDPKYQATLLEVGSKAQLSSSPEQFADMIRKEVVETTALMLKLGLRKT